MHHSETQLHYFQSSSCLYSSVVEFQLCKTNIIILTDNYRFFNKMYRYFLTRFHFVFKNIQRLH